MKKIMFSLVIALPLSLGNGVFAADPQPTNPPTPTVPANPNGPGNEKLDPGEKTVTVCEKVWDIGWQVWNWWCWTKTIKKVVIDEDDESEQAPVGALYCPDIQINSTTVLSNVRVNLSTTDGTNVKVVDAYFSLPSTRPFSSSIEKWLNANLGTYAQRCYSAYMNQ